MELILLSVFGTAMLILLELCGLFYQRWLDEPHLPGSDLPAAPSANQPGDATTVRTITKHGGIDVHCHPKVGDRIRWYFVDDVSAESALHCSDAANDAGATTIRRAMSRDIRRESTGE